jgi:hypothetical protein
MLAGKAALPRRFPQAKHRPGIIGLEKSSGYELPELPFLASRLKPPLGGFPVCRTKRFRFLRLEIPEMFLGHSHCVQPAFAVAPRSDATKRERNGRREFLPPGKMDRNIGKSGYET